MCDECSKPDRVECNCVKLFYVTWYEKGEPFTSNYKYKSLPDFYRYCELHQVDISKYTNIELVV